MCVGGDKPTDGPDQHTADGGWFAAFFGGGTDHHRLRDSDAGCAVLQQYDFEYYGWRQRQCFYDRLYRRYDRQ